MKSIVRQVRISPKKSNLVAALVRNKKALDALDILKFTPKKAAPVVRKAIQSAIANAETNFKQKRENLYIKEIIVNEGTTYKRRMPVSRGRAHPILKRTSHITIKLHQIEIEANEPKGKEKTSETAKVVKPKKSKS